MKLYSLAGLGNDQLQQIKSLEKQLGKTIIALKGHETNLAELSTEQLAMLKQSEGKLGLTLIAVQ